MEWNVDSLSGQRFRIERRGASMWEPIAYSGDSTSAARDYVQRHNEAAGTRLYRVVSDSHVTQELMLPEIDTAEHDPRRRPQQPARKIDLDALDRECRWIVQSIAERVEMGHPGDIEVERMIDDAYEMIDRWENKARYACGYYEIDAYLMIRELGGEPCPADFGWIKTGVELARSGRWPE